MAKIPLNIRIDPELRERLKKQAHRENRTLSNLVDTIVREYLDEKSRRSRKR
jgi:predicted DNA-binding protein